jgi:hypothetical protein
MLEKRFHNHYYNQTNPKKQPKTKTNLKKRPKKCLCPQSIYNNNQKERFSIYALSPCCSAFKLALSFDVVAAQSQILKSSR